MTLNPLILKQSRPAMKDRAVVFCCDNNLSDLIAFVIHRLLEAEPDPDYEFCVCTFDPLLKLPEQIVPDVRICWLDPAAFEGFPVTDSLPISTYLCLTPPGIFAADYDRIVALDCDILPINAKMSELLNMDMKGRPVAAVLDQCEWRMEPSRTILSYRRSLGIETLPYFNAGVILFDVAGCSEIGFAEGIMDYMRNNAPNFRYGDQSALNGYMKGNILPLSVRWNWQAIPQAFHLIPRFNPRIVHFIGPRKPYMENARGNTRVYRQVYEDYFRNVLKKELSFKAHPKTKTSGSKTRTKRSLPEALVRLASRMCWPHKVKIIRRLYEPSHVGCKLDEIERAIARGTPVWPRKARRAGLMEP